jgi:hypothetical protein
MNNYRLTVHITDVQKVEVSTGQRIKNDKGLLGFQTKRKIFNTLSFYCATKEDCLKTLQEVRSKYTIAKGEAGKHKDHKIDKELYNISFVK